MAVRGDSCGIATPQTREVKKKTLYVTVLGHKIDVFVARRMRVKAACVVYVYDVQQCVQRAKANQAARDEEFLFLTHILLASSLYLFKYNTTEKCLQTFFALALMVCGEVVDRQGNKIINTTATRNLTQHMQTDTALKLYLT